MLTAKFIDGPMAGKGVFVDTFSKFINVPVVSHAGFGNARYVHLGDGKYACDEYDKTSWAGSPTIGPEAEKYVPVYAKDED